MEFEVSPCPRSAGEENWKDMKIMMTRWWCDNGVMHKDEP